jgi:hypothetical protein
MTRLAPGRQTGKVPPHQNDLGGYGVYQESPEIRKIVAR